MQEQSQLSPRMVARAIGVSESSLKRWCDQGLLKTARTAGGHRRVGRSEVIRFVRERKLTVAEPEVLGLPRLESSTLSSEPKIVHMVRTALLDGHEEVVRKLVVSLYVSGWELERIFDDIIATVFHSIGELWRCEELEIYKERHSCEIIVNVLRELRAVIPQASVEAPLAIGASLPGDHYALPSLICEMMMTSLGWNASSIGTNLPLNALQRACEDYEPTLVWISFSHIPAVGEEPVREFTKRFNEFAASLSKDTSLVIGGRAITAEIRKQLQFTVCFDTMKQMRSYIENPNHFKKPDSPAS